MFAVEIVAYQLGKNLIFLFLRFSYSIAQAAQNNYENISEARLYDFAQ